jgi:hypothetical protein
MKTFLLFSLLSFSGFAQALVATSGVQLCGKTPTLYAFYEGSSPRLHNIKLWADDKKLTREDYLEKAHQHLLREAPGIEPYITERLNPILKTLDDKLVSKLQTYSIKTDVVFLDPGCTYQAASLWNDESDILSIDKKIFKRLSPMGQAGLLYLEAIYKFQREVQGADQTSNFPRSLVAKIFSDAPLIPPVTAYQKTSEGSMNFCISSLKLLTSEAPVFVDALKLCKKYGKGQEYFDAYQRIKALVQSTIDGCLEKCHWDQGIQTCQSYQSLIDQKNPCD